MTLVFLQFLHFIPHLCLRKDQVEGLQMLNLCQTVRLLHHPHLKIVLRHMLEDVRVQIGLGGEAKPFEACALQGCEPAVI